MALLRQSLAEIRVANGEWTSFEANSLLLPPEYHCEDPAWTEPLEDCLPFEDRDRSRWS
jgi:hypothetical protein